MLRACAGIDAVIHLAGEPRGLPESPSIPFAAMRCGRSSPSMPRCGAALPRLLCASSINAFGTFF